MHFPLILFRVSHIDAPDTSKGAIIHFWITITNIKIIAMLITRSRSHNSIFFVFSFMDIILSFLIFVYNII